MTWSAGLSTAMLATRTICPVGRAAANEVIQVVGRVDSVHSSLLTALFLLVIYVGHFIATCPGAWRAMRGTDSRG